MLSLAAPNTVEPPPTPSVELLMYLGEFEDASGDFVDPMAVEGNIADREGNQLKPDKAEEDDVPE